MDDLTQNATPHYPRSDRPLFGLTVLVVEDSNFSASEFAFYACEVARGFVGLIACALQDAIFRFTALRW